MLGVEPRLRVGRNGYSDPDISLARRWGRTMRRRGRGSVSAVWERRGLRRAWAAGLVAAVALLATVPATSPLHPGPSKLAAPSAPRGLPVEEARARIGPVPVGTAASKPALVASAAGELAITPPPATFDGPAAPTAPPPETLRAPAGPGTGGMWAVMIGIDDYPGSRSDLRQSVRDANDTDAALAAYGIPPDRRMVIRNAQASAGVIADAARWLVARAGPDATVVFFYAGHVRKLASGVEAIVAADGKLVTDRTLADLLRPLRARQTWIVLASCYAGGFDEVVAPGRILTGAAPANRLAYENSAYGNSYLVEYMIDRAMLQGRAAGSVEQSFSWALEALRRDHPDRLPVQIDRLDGELRLGPPPTSAAPATPPPPTTPPSQPPSEQPPAPPPEDDDCVLTLGSLVGCDDRSTRG